MNIRSILFNILINSKAFQRFVHRTEQSLLKGLRNFTDSDRAKQEFIREQVEATEKLAQKAKEELAKKSKSTVLEGSTAEYPSYLPKSLVDNYRRMRYDYGVWKNKKWFK